MWVKICGNTNLADAQAAIDLGADAVGFVFAPSKRQVTAEAVVSIGEHLTGSAELFGVFQTMHFAEIRSAIRAANLTGAQLHGGLSTDLIVALRDEFGLGLSITQVLHWDIDAVPTGLQQTVASLREAAQVNRILIDSKVGNALGGTGIPFDWNAAKDLFSSAGMEMIVAGGLHPENVGEAIQRLQPFGVDVSSGVESEPGRKDRERLRLFIQRARAAGDDLRS